MRTIWATPGPVTVRDVLERLNDGRTLSLAYTTVMTVLARLAEKGVLARRSHGRSYLYEAAVKDAAEIAVRGVLRDFGDSAVAAFLDEARDDARTLRRLQRLLREEP